MPTYEAICPVCLTRQDYIRKIDDRFNTPKCEKCGGETEKAITTCMVPCMPIAESMHVVSPIDNSVLRSKSDYENHMKKHGVRPASEFEGVKPPEYKIDRAELAQTISDSYDKLVG